jgi:hypothetical protein
MTTERATPESPRLLRKWRCRDVAGVIVPGVLLALIPKCPACLAGYVAVATGVGLTFTTAEGLRAVLMGLCGAALGVFAWRWWRRV